MLALAVGPFALLMGGCSYFSTEPDPRMVNEVHKVVPLGMEIDEAESNLLGLGFACSNRHGEYDDETGATRNAAAFMLCERRPGSLSFNCENRDRVVLLQTSSGKVNDVEVSRGPSCTRP
jgi:hypothetical protein